MDEALIVQAENALIKADSVLGAAIKLQRPLSIRSRNGYFASLCRSIIGQQISVSAAAAIFSRFEVVTKMDPRRVMAIGDEQIKMIGLSRQKILYLKDLAAHFVKNPAVYDHLDKLDDDEVITDLTKVKGVGVWSAQMFLMFTLGRPDVFAPDDVGLQRAIVKLYGYDNAPAKDQLLKLAEKWRPYRAVASMHLWKTLNNSPTK